MLPREHGSWALLLVPLLLGLGGSAVPSAAAALVLAAAISLFLARAPLGSLLSPAPEGRAPRWLALYGMTALISAALLFGLYGRWRLPLYGAPIAAALAWTLRPGRLTVADELVAVAAMSLGAPVARYAVSGRLDAEGWLLAGLCFSYLSCPIFHVRAAVAAHRAAAGPGAAGGLQAARRATVAAHAAALVAAGALAAGWEFSWLAVLPYGLALLKTLRLVAAPPAKADFKRLGWTEAAHAALFLLLVSAARP